MAHPPECEDEPWHTPVALQECAHGERTRNLRLVGRDEVSLGELIHQAVRRTIDQAVDEELRATQGAAPYERRAERNGYRNGAKTRTLTGPTGPVELTLPRGRLTTRSGARRWCLGTSAACARSTRPSLACTCRAVTRGGSEEPCDRCSRTRRCP